MSDERKPARQRRPFATSAAAHTVVRAAESLDWDLSNTEAFLARAQHIEYGLSAEIEFAAILRWLGVCKFVHRLNEDKFSAPDSMNLEVPDLFAVFKSNNATVSALIEVKTTDGFDLPLKRPYLEKLQSYAALLAQPLLIAWKPRKFGSWILFDPRIADGAAETITFDRAVRNDLMSVIAGDSYIVAMEGVGLRFEAQRISEKQATANGYEATFQISDAGFYDAHGVKEPKVPNAVAWAVLSDAEHAETFSDNGFVKSFLASGNMTRAQSVLRTAASFSLEEDERIHWKAISEKFNQILSREALIAEAEAAFGRFIRYILYQQPQIVPDFLGKSWLAEVNGRFKS